MVVLTACNHSADVDDNDNSATGGKGVSFTLSMADWEDAPTVGMPATKATARSTEQLEFARAQRLALQALKHVLQHAHHYLQAITPLLLIRVLTRHP